VEVEQFGVVSTNAEILAALEDPSKWSADLIVLVAWPNGLMKALADGVLRICHAGKQHVEEIVDAEG